MSEKLYTIEEVNALVPKLEYWMTRIVQERERLAEAVLEIAGRTGRSPQDVDLEQLLASRPELSDSVEALAQWIEEIEAVGGQIKGLEMGLVDFPGEHAGNVVCLCWQLGEKEVSHYHGLDEGFANRKPLVRGARSRVVFQ